MNEQRVDSLVVWLERPCRNTLLLNRQKLGEGDIGGERVGLVLELVL